MEEKHRFFDGAVTGCLLAAAVMTALCIFYTRIYAEYNYKQGQIDAMNGVWKYKAETKTVTFYVEKN